ncbi:MAG: galactose mutarotase [Prevotellaceae bacterium]|jgi:aldose 1-epimerase|nr:galactose mutarotase [Prevotellaceae bacterium]
MDSPVLLRLANSSGAYIEALSYGATLVKAVVPDRHGRLENVLLSYPDAQGYLADECYLGSTVGRFANRISGAKFTLNGQTCLLDKNDGENCNHGGFAGFSKKMFRYRADAGRLIFAAQSRDGEGGFPGNVNLEVAYSFSDDNELLIAYTLTSDKTTVVNLTNHAYFNLCPRTRSILSHELAVNADQRLEFDEHFLPTGKILPVANTGFDFSDFRSVGQMMLQKSEPGIKGYNAYFIGKSAGEKGGLPWLASLRESESGRLLEVYSTTSGVQLYTGDFLSGAHLPFEGLCLEAQGYPDAPNHPHFPSCVVEANQEYRQEIRYRFKVA